MHLAQAPGVAGRTPGSWGSSRAPARCPASARRTPQPGWGAQLVQVSGLLAPPRRPVNYAGGWHRRARVAQVSPATFARASLLPAAGLLRPRIPCATQAPPQGVRGAGGAWRQRPRTRHLSWDHWIVRAGATPSEGLASGVRRARWPGWTSAPGFGGHGGRGGPRRRGSEGAGVGVSAR